MIYARRLALALICAVLPVAAAAHPHVFIDVSLSLRYDAQGRLAGVDEVWSYDELYSLLMLSEAGDPLGRGFEGAQMAALQGLDANWDPLNGGVMQISLGSAAVATAPVRHISTRLEGDRVVSRRSHALVRPVDGAHALQIRVYDPTYYVAFAMPAQVTLQGRDDCRITRQAGQGQGQADAYASALRDALARELGQGGSDTLRVDIGAQGADAIGVSCPG